MRLNLGCGNDILAGWVNLDLVKLDGVDIQHDLDVGPWPLDDDRFSYIRAFDIFEHVKDPILFMTECHRVLRRGGVLHIRTPHVGTIEAHTDPTHVRFCTPWTWDFWIPGTNLHASRNLSCGNVSYLMADRHRDGAAIDISLEKLCA